MLDHACAGLLYHLETTRAELFERHYLDDGKVVAAVFAAKGEAAAELSALIEDWSKKRGEAAVKVFEKVVDEPPETPVASRAPQGKERGHDSFEDVSGA